MARPYSFGGVELDVNAGEAVAVAEAEPLQLKPESENPFRILILGDFSGRGCSSVSRPLRVDRDNLDQVIKTLGVQANLSLGGKNPISLPLKFESLEDFEPDSLFRRCELFRTLDKASKPVPPAKSEAIGLRLGSLLDAIVEQHETAGERETSEPAHLPDAPERKEQSGLLMRAILHEPHFQALEAAWRSLDFLVRNIERDDLIKVYIFDTPKQKLEADLLQSPEFRSSDAYRVIVEESVQTPGAEPWALILGNYGFDRNSSRDVDLLAQMGLLARAAQAPFLAEAIPSSGPNQAGHESWEALRLSSHASWLGLALPRLLLRLPYGEETSRTESFSFEEMPRVAEDVAEHVPQHNEYLWGNPAFGCAYLIALSFAELGWDFRPGLHRQISGLPLHIYKSQGVTRVQPCAELLLTESDCEELLDQGLMPVASVKDRDSVRLIRFQSIAKPAAALSGRWV